MIGIEMTRPMMIGLAVCALAGTPGTGFAQEHDHAGHSHAADSPTDDAHDHARAVHVTKEQAARLGIKVSRAALGTVAREIRVPAEIRINSDRMAHVVPQTPGIVLKVSAVMGQRVKKGQVLAVIRSRELAEAKATYLASVERLKLAQEVFTREERLHETRVSPEQDYMAARQALAEAKILRRSASQKLSTLGVSVARLSQLESEPEDEFALYRIISPFDGTVIGKHIVLGEVLDGQEKVFEVADLTSVWVDLAISQDAISSVRRGHAVSLRLPDRTTAEATIGFVSPIVSAATRTALARATMVNTGERFRPGTFADATIHIPSPAEAIVIPASCIQLVDDRTCVFVWAGKGVFELREITTGVSDRRNVEVLGGLRAGDSVASVGAFHLKGELTKSDGGGCSAHGHAH